MSITTAVTRRFDNNYVQVDITPKNGDVKYYKLPEAKADSFQKEYVQNSKDQYWKDTAITIGSIFGTIILAALCTKKIENSTLRMAIGIGGGLTGGLGSSVICEKLNENSHKKLLKKYNAEQLDYSKNKLSI